MRRRFRLALARRTGVARRRDVDAELSFHIEERIEELVGRGVPRERAEREVRERFGDLAGVRAECEAIDTVTDRRRSRREWLAAASREARRAFHVLVRRPAFSAAVVVTLSLGIGAATAIFTVLDRVALRPLAYPSAERLVHVRHPVPGISATAEWNLSVAGYFHVRNTSRTLDGLAGYAPGLANLASDRGTDRVRTAVVDPRIFGLLGIRPALGRLLTPAEVRPDSAAPVAILSYGFWERHFGGDPKVVGRVVRLDGRPVELVGVLAQGADLPDWKTDVWQPVVLDSAAAPQNSHWVRAIGRLRDGVTRADAERELRAIVARFPELFPSAYTPAFLRDSRFTVRVIPLREDLLRDVGRRLWTLFGAVGLVLMVACANVANLFLARHEAQRRGAAVRVALGAARSDLAWHYLTESLLLALTAAALGIGLAWAGLGALLAAAPPDLPRFADVKLGWTSVSVAASIAVLAGGTFGLIPLLRRTEDVAALRFGGRGLVTSRTRHAVRRALVISQVALALVLLAGAGLMLQTVRGLRKVEPGFEPRGALTFEVMLPPARYAAAALAPFYEALLGRVAALPGVTAVGVTTSLPLKDGVGCAGVTREDSEGAGDRGACVSVPRVSPGYFRALGIRVTGRAVEWHDEHRKAGEVVVTRALADRLWPGQDPIGKGLLGGMRPEGPPWYRVVGVAEGVRHAGLDKPPVEAVYFPLVPLDSAPLWAPPRYVTVVVRTRLADPVQLVPAVRRVLHETDAEVPLANPQTMEAIVARSMARTSLTTTLLSIAAAMALVLSAVGLYGVVAYLVTEQRAEIGVRLALGARSAQVRRVVVLQSVRMAAIGIVVGLFGALAGMRVLRAMLYDVSPADPAVLALASGTLLLVAAIAACGPAYRAARVDPVDALRTD